MDPNNTQQPDSQRRSATELSTYPSLSAVWLTAVARERGEVKENTLSLETWVRLEKGDGQTDARGVYAVKLVTH